eukprot:TRINITY_DN3348_c0_g1_i1.p1 TRINITY_DN3348_c0_g1~~TRINITY_DN3348_c0_g1_i1.p1  ORF type:complete len:130 (-),score=52.88 TRINITY_DN3348_c0_g1_i1:85-474(-)
MCIRDRSLALLVNSEQLHDRELEVTAEKTGGLGGPHDRKARGLDGSELLHGGLGTDVVDLKLAGVILLLDDDSEVVSTGLPVESDGVSGCLLYTSDAADDLLCVDLGGRRIIKKKKQTINWMRADIGKI